MGGTKSFKVGNENYDNIPEAEVKDFLQQFPDAVEVNTFLVGGKDTFDIPVQEVEAFKADNPEAKPLEVKKKVGGESQPSTSESGSSDAEIPELKGPWFDPAQFLTRTPTTTQFSQDDIKPKVKFTAVGEGEPAGGQEMAVQTATRQEREKYNKALNYLSLANQQKQVFNMDEGQRQKLLNDFKNSNPDVPLSTAQQALNELDRAHLKKSAATYAQELKAAKAKQIADRMGSEDYFPKPGENINPEVQAEQQIKNELYQYGIDAMNAEQKKRFLAVQKLNQLKTKTTSEGDAIKLLTPGEQKLVKEFKEQQLYDQWGNQIDADTLSKKEKENQKDINDLTQAYAQNYQGKAKELYEEKAMALMYVDDLLNQQTPNKAAGYPVTYKKLVDIGGLGAPDLLLSADQKQAKRLVDVRQQAWNEFEAAKRIYLLNQDPAKIGDATWSRFTDSMEQGFKGSLFAPLVDNLYNPENLSRGEFQDTYKQFAEEGLPISEKQKEEFTIEFIDKFAQTAGFSIPTMLEIGASTALMNEVGAATGITKLAQALEAANTAKYGKGGKLLTNLMMNTAKGYVAYAPTQETGWTGAGEGSAQTFIDMLNPEKWAGGKYRKFFEFAARVGVGTTGETIQEYSGQFVNALAQNGMNWEQVFSDTFGRTPEDKEDQLLLTVLQSAMFSGAFNIGVLKDGLVALTQSKKPEAKQLIPVVEKVIEEREEEIKDQEAAAAGKPPEPKKPGDGGGGAAEIITKPKDEKGGITNGQEEKNPLLGEQPGGPTKAGGATKADALPATEEDAEVVDEVTKVMEGMKVPEEKPTLEVAGEVKKPVVEISTEELEKMWENPKDDNELDEVEKELQKRERDSVFGGSLQDAGKALDKLLLRHKNYKTEGEPFVSQKDAKQAKNVVERYTDTNLLSDQDIKDDFKEALMGNSTTSYADGLQLRESANAASQRDIPTKELIAEVQKEMEAEGIDANDAKDLITQKLRDLKPRKLPKVDKTGNVKREKIIDLTQKQKKKNNFRKAVRKYGEFQPTSPRQAVLQFFALGGRINADEAIRRTGYKHKDLFGWTGKKGTSYDRLVEQVRDILGDQEFDELDLLNEIDAIISGPKKAVFDELREVIAAEKGDFGYDENADLYEATSDMQEEEQDAILDETDEWKYDALTPQEQEELNNIVADEMIDRGDYDGAIKKYGNDENIVNLSDQADAKTKTDTSTTPGTRGNLSQKDGDKETPTTSDKRKSELEEELKVAKSRLSKADKALNAAKESISGQRDMFNTAEQGSLVQDDKTEMQKQMNRLNKERDVASAEVERLQDELTNYVKGQTKLEIPEKKSSAEKKRELSDEQFFTNAKLQKDEVEGLLNSDIAEVIDMGKGKERIRLTDKETGESVAFDEYDGKYELTGYRGGGIEYVASTMPVKKVEAVIKKLANSLKEQGQKAKPQKSKQELLNEIAEETGTTREHIDLIRSIGAQFGEMQSREAKKDNYQRMMEKYEKSPSEKLEKQIRAIEKELGYAQSWFDLRTAGEDATADQALQDNPALSLEGFAKLVGKTKEQVRAEWEAAFDKKMKDDKWVKKYNATQKPKTPPADKTQQRKVRDEKLNKEIDDLWDEFGKDIKPTMGLDPSQLAIGIKIISKYTQAGVYKLSDILEDASIRLGERFDDLFDAIKAAYNAYYDQAPDDVAEQMDDSREVKKVKKEQFKKKPEEKKPATKKVSEFEDSIDALTKEEKDEFVLNGIISEIISKQSALNEKDALRKQFLGDITRVFGSKASTGKSQVTLEFSESQQPYIEYLQRPENKEGGQLGTFFNTRNKKETFVVNNPEFFTSQKKKFEELSPNVQTVLDNSNARVIAGMIDNKTYTKEDAFEQIDQSQVRNDAEKAQFKKAIEHFLPKKQSSKQELIDDFKLTLGEIGVENPTKFLEKHGVASIEELTEEQLREGIDIGKNEEPFLFTKGEKMREFTHEGKKFKKIGQGLHTKGVWKSEDGKVYKALESRDDRKDDKNKKGYLTEEGKLLQEMQGEQMIPKAGAIIETPIGPMIEIEPLTDAKSITQEEYQQVEKAIENLHAKGWWYGDKVKVMRDAAGNLKLADFSSSRKKESFDRGYTEYMDDVKALVKSPKAQSIHDYDGKTYTSKDGIDYQVKVVPDGIGAYITDINKPQEHPMWINAKDLLENINSGYFTEKFADEGEIKVGGKYELTDGVVTVTKIDKGTWDTGDRKHVVDLVDYVYEDGREIKNELLPKFKNRITLQKHLQKKSNLESDAKGTETKSGTTGSRSGPSDTPAVGGGSASQRPAIRVVDEGNIPKPRDHVRVGQYDIDEHQRLGVNLAIETFDKGKKGFLLGDGTGIGKTREILVAAAEWKKRSGKPVLIVTQNKQIIEGSFTADSKALGINLSEFDMHTYTDVSGGKIPKKDYGLVIYDEAHNMKNADSQKAIAAQAIKADHKMFATATPMDRPISAAYFLSEITGKPMEQIQKMLGFVTSMQEDPVTKQMVMRVHPQEGQTWTQVFQHIIDLRNEAIRNGQMIRREYPFYGAITSDRVSLGLDFHTEQQAISDFWDEQIEEAQGFKRKNLAGQRIGELSRHTEASKVEVAYQIAKKAIAEGKAVIIVGEGVNETAIKAFAGNKLPGLLGELAKRFERDGISVAKIFGTGDKSDAIARFNKGEAQVALATPQSGGTGVNLDDTIGDRPRLMLLATTNYSGDQMDQMFGRVSRRNTKSPAEIRLLVANESMSDSRRLNIFEQKATTLRRVQAGEDPDMVELEQSNDDVENELKQSNESEPYTKVVNGQVFVYNSYHIKDRLKAIGARWHKFQKAWVLPHNMLDAAQKIVDEKRNLAQDIRNKKITGPMVSFDLGISRTLYNEALEFIAKQVERGTALGNAVESAIYWVDAKINRIEWKKDEFIASINNLFSSKFNGGDMPEGTVIADKIDVRALTRIPGGSSRDVYDLGDKVIKVAKNPKGLEQNSSMGYGDVHMLAPHVPEIFERGEDYIVTEKVPRNDKEIRKFLAPLQKFSDMDFKNRTEALHDVMEELGLSDFNNYELLWNDFIAPRNWGMRADGTPVLIDEGALNNRVHFSSKPDPWAVKAWDDIKRARKYAPQKMRDRIIEAINSMKIDTSGKQAYTLPFPPQIWNGFVEAVKLAAQGGFKLAEAIEKGVEWLRDQGVTETEINDYKTYYNDTIFKSVKSSGIDERRFMKRFLADEEVLDEIKDEISEDAKEYAVKSNIITNNEANEIIKNLGVDATINFVLDFKNDLSHRVRVALSQNILRRLNRQISRAANDAEKRDALNKAINLSEELAKYGTELGQGVQAFAMWSKLSPEGILMYYRKEGKRARTDHRRTSPDATEEPLTPEEIAEEEAFERELAELAEQRDEAPEGFLQDEITVQILNKIKERTEKKWGRRADILWSLWYASVLSGWQTQAVNFGSNLINGSVETFISGIQQAAIYKDFSAIPKMLGAMWNGLEEGGNQFNYIMRKGASHGKKADKVSTSDVLERTTLPGGKLNPYNYYKFVPRLMSAVDNMAYYGLYHMRFYEMARKLAREEGLSGTSLENKVRSIMVDDTAAFERAKIQAEAEVAHLASVTGQEYKDYIVKKRAYEILDQRRRDKYPDLITEADKFASFATFNYNPQGWLGAASQAAATLGRRVPPFRLIVPFTRIVANVLNQQLDYTPYGFLRAQGWNASEMYSKHIHETASKDASTAAQNNEDKQRLIFKAAIGTSLLMGLYALTKIREEDDDEEKFFDIHGRGPTDANKRNQLFAQGWKPYSIQIGNKYFSYQYNPLSYGFTLVGNYRDYEKFKELGEKDFFTRFSFAVGQVAPAIMEMSFLSGLSDFIERMGRPSNPETFVEGMFGGTAGSFKPLLPVVGTSFVKQASEIFDPTIYDAETISQSLMKGIPFAQQTGLKPKLNVLGQDAEKTGNRFWSVGNDDPVWKMLSEKKVFLPAIGRTTKLNGEPMNYEQYYEYVQRSGQLMYEDLKSNMDEYSAMSNKEADEAIDKRAKEIRNTVKNEMEVTVIAEKLKSSSTPQQDLIRMLKEKDISREQYYELKQQLKK